MCYNSIFGTQYHYNVAYCVANVLLTVLLMCSQYHYNVALEATYRRRLQGTAPDESSDQLPMPASLQHTVGSGGAQTAPSEGGGGWGGASENMLQVGQAQGVIT
jgi:hypothetical protein